MSMPLILFSHALNVLVLASVLHGFWKGTPGINSTYGPETVARGILVSVFIAILLASVFCVAVLVSGSTRLFLTLSAALFTFQIIYTMVTAVIVGLQSSVVVANLAISAVHAVTLVFVYLRLTDA